jgi:hypothetical protein
VDHAATPVAGGIRSKPVLGDCLLTKYSQTIRTSVLHLCLSAVTAADPREAR